MKKNPGQDRDSLSRFNDFISARMGIEFPQTRWNDLAAAANTAAREFGFTDAETFIDHLEAFPLSVERFERLAGLLTNGETYFWREPLVFDALVNSILPELVRFRESTDRRLRIWSAGCSSGEEPYSIAIALRKVIADISDWDVKILATDLNTEHLKKASVGAYGEWSFRDAPDGLMRENLRVRNDGKREVLPEIQDMVDFACLNLVADEYPQAMDIIFCRNVLMYFSRDRAVEVGKKLYDSLAEGGWLFVSASELSQEIFPQFEAVRIDGAFAYRKRLTATVAPVAVPAWTADPVWTAKPSGIFSVGVLPERIERAPDVVETPPTKGPDETLPLDVKSYIRTLADRGYLAGALTLCDEALSADKLDPVLHYLRAVILQESNRTEEAIGSLQRALYVDPKFILAHFTLGNLQTRNGDPKTGRRCYENALALLADLAESDVLSDSVDIATNMTALRFGEIIRSAMRTGAPV
ncbi:MAG: CheR family methyltransferase [Treponemataceae bacterium]